MNFERIIDRLPAVWLRAAAIFFTLLVLGMLAFVAVATNPALDARRDLIAGIFGGAAALTAAWVAWDAIQKQIAAANTDAERSRRAAIAASNRSLVERTSQLISAMMRVDLRHIDQTLSENIGGAAKLAADLELNLIMAFRRASTLHAAAALRVIAATKGPQAVPRGILDDYKRARSVLSREALCLQLLFAAGHALVDLMFKSEDELHDMVRRYVTDEELQRFYKLEFAAGSPRSVK